MTAPSAEDIRKVKLLLWMRTRHFRTVNLNSTGAFRRRRMPVHGSPAAIPACSKFAPWLPPILMVPHEVPADARLPPRYLLSYYGLGKAIWKSYNKVPIDSAVEWDPSFWWNTSFPPTGDGWGDPTDDETFARLRTQGPNPWGLRAVADGVTSGTGQYRLDFSRSLAGVLPPVVADFVVRDGRLVPESITVGDEVATPGDPTWAQAKRVVNAADARYVTFVLHLLHTHLIIGQAYALAAYSLPVSHPLRPFMHFFTYSTLAVNHIAYGSLITEDSYFLKAGFVGPADLEALFANAIAAFDLDEWDAAGDVARRGVATIPGHAFAQDAPDAWQAFEEVVDRHLWDLELDDATIAADQDLQRWHRALYRMLPNTEVDVALTRDQLRRLLLVLLWNNVKHEICGDLSPLLGSQNPEVKAMTRLANVRDALVRGGLEAAPAPPTMSDVFLIDQASYVSRFNVAGNNILTVDAAAMVDDPRLRMAIEDLQATLSELDTRLAERNQSRPVAFKRMLPTHWEASISF